MWNMTKQLADNKFQLSVAMLFVHATSTCNKLRTFLVKECELLICFKILSLYCCVAFKDRQTDRQTDDRQTDGLRDNWLGGRKEGTKWVNGRIDGLIDGWMKEVAYDDLRTCISSANCIYYFSFQGAVNICE